MTAMPAAFAILLVAQLIGEVLRRVLHLPLPGPVIGMILLAIVLAVKGRSLLGSNGQAPLAQLSQSLIANMGLLFVPAGVGIMAELSVLKDAWLPILAGLLVSTASGLIVTGWVMHRLSRATAPAHEPALPSFEKEAKP